jgi:Mce-associated membrane protein
MSSPTWYDLLDVDPAASTEEVRAAWKSAIADLDPTDRRFATLTEAAGVLLDAERRQAYDAELAERAAAQAAEVEIEPEVEPGARPEAEEKPAAEADPGERPATVVVATSPAPRRAPYLLPGWVLAMVAVLAVAAVVLAAVLAGHRPADKVIQGEATLSSGTKVTDIEQSAADAEAAARTAIVPLLSYDYRHLDADQSKAERYLTDSYRKSYDSLFGVIKQNAPGTQTVITTKVVESGIVRVNGDRVQVLLFVDRPTTNKASTTPIPYQDQVTATMQKVGDSWLVDNLVTTPVSP